MRSLLRVAIVFFLFTAFPKVHAQEVVVHSSVKQESISRNTLRAIFGMRHRKWPDGFPIKVFVLRDDASLHISFSKSILYIFPYQLRRAWDRQVYSGTGQAPNEVESIEEMRKKIADTPGAIGYLPLPENHENEVDTALRVLHVR